jgi:hypothetical protein
VHLARCYPPKEGQPRAPKRSFDEHCKDKEISKGTRQANDPDLANGLWELSAKLTNLK